MKPSELRIGNWVKQGIVHFVGYSSEHSGYFGAYIYKSPFDSMGARFYKEAELEPIPLTEE